MKKHQSQNAEKTKRMSPEMQPNEMKKPREELPFDFVTENKRSKYSKQKDLKECDCDKEMIEERKYRKKQFQNDLKNRQDCDSDDEQKKLEIKKHQSQNAEKTKRMSPEMQPNEMKKQREELPFDSETENKRTKYSKVLQECVCDESIIREIVKRRKKFENDLKNCQDSESDAEYQEEKLERRKYEPQIEEKTKRIPVQMLENEKKKQKEEIVLDSATTNVRKKYTTQKPQLEKYNEDSNRSEERPKNKLNENKVRNKEIKSPPRTEGQDKTKFKSGLERRQEKKNEEDWTSGQTTLKQKKKSSQPKSPTQENKTMLINVEDNSNDESNNRTEDQSLQKTLFQNKINCKTKVCEVECQPIEGKTAEARAEQQKQKKLLLEVECFPEVQRTNNEYQGKMRPYVKADDTLIKNEVGLDIKSLQRPRRPMEENDQEKKIKLQSDNKENLGRRNEQRLSAEKTNRKLERKYMTAVESKPPAQQERNSSEKTERKQERKYVKKPIVSQETNILGTYERKEQVKNAKGIDRKLYSPQDRANAAKTERNPSGKYVDNAVVKPSQQQKKTAGEKAQEKQKRLYIERTEEKPERNFEVKKEGREEMKTSPTRQPSKNVLEKSDNDETQFKGTDRTLLEEDDDIEIVSQHTAEYSNEMNAKEVDSCVSFITVCFSNLECNCNEEDDSNEVIHLVEGQEAEELDDADYKKHVGEMQRIQYVEEEFSDGESEKDSQSNRTDSASVDEWSCDKCISCDLTVSVVNVCDGTCDDDCPNCGAIGLLIKTNTSEKPNNTTKKPYNSNMKR